MDIDKYRELIKSLIEKYADEDSEGQDVEAHIAFDRERDCYVMFHLGWREEKRVYGCVMHIEIKEGKIWIQRDGIEAGIANELIELGVPKSDLVLGYRSPYMRQFTELAVG